MVTENLLGGRSFRLDQHQLCSIFPEKFASVQFLGLNLMCLLTNFEIFYSFYK